MTSLVPDRSESLLRHAAGITALLTLLLCGMPALAQQACSDEDALWTADGPVYAIATDNDRRRLYVGGAFTSIGGQPRDNLAAFDLESCAVTGWDPSPNGAVRTMVLTVDGTALYVGGDFTTIAGRFRNHLAALRATSGAALAWNPGANAPVHVMIPATADSFFIGGEFTVVSGEPRQKFAGIRLADGDAEGAALSFDAGATVYALAMGGPNLVYIGGDFEQVGVGAGTPQTRRRIAALDTSTLNLSEWAPSIDDGEVRALLLAPGGGTLYAAGSFTAAGGGGPGSQVGVVALDPAVGETVEDPVREDWNPQVDIGGTVSAIRISLDRTVMYLGGDFASVGGAGGPNLAAIRIPTQVIVDPSEWNTSANAPVFSLHLVEDQDVDPELYRLYAGGDFTAITVDGVVQARSGIASLATLPPETDPPTTIADPPGGQIDVEDTGQTPGTQIRLICDDGDGSGCAVTYYTIDGSDPDPVNNPANTRTYSTETPILLTADMETLELRFYSVDNVGNAEDIRTETYTVGGPDPIETFASPRSQAFEDALTVTLTCTATTTTCAATYYTLNGPIPTLDNDGNPVPPTRLYEGPITITGTTVVQFRSVDDAGSLEAVRRAEYRDITSTIGALSLYETLAAIALAGLSWWHRRRRAR